MLLWRFEWWAWRGFQAAAPLLPLAQASHEYTRTLDDSSKAASLTVSPTPLNFSTLSQSRVHQDARCSPGLSNPSNVHSANLRSPASDPFQDLEICQVSSPKPIAPLDAPVGPGAVSGALVSQAFEELGPLRHQVLHLGSTTAGTAAPFDTSGLTQELGSLEASKCAGTRPASEESTLCGL